jgi:hypothetical protein
MYYLVKKKIFAPPPFFIMLNINALQASILKLLISKFYTIK